MWFASSLWSNGVVADSDASESPWAHDVPAPQNSSLPDDPWAERRRADRRSSTFGPPTDPAGWRRPAAVGETDDSDTRSRTRHDADDAAAGRGGATGRLWLVSAGIVVLVAAVASWVLLAGPAGDGDSPDAAEARTSVMASTSSTRTGNDTRPSTTLRALTPVLPPAGSTLPDNETVIPTTAPLDVLVPDLEPAPIGAAPSWTEWNYPVPPALQRLAEPTELVALTTNGVLHRLEFPSGVVRSIDTGAAGRNASMYVSGDSLVLQQFDSLMLLRPGVPVREVDIGVSIGSVIPRGDTGTFLVAPNEWSGGPPPLWVVDETGTATSLAKADNPLADNADFPLQFLPTGELLVFDAGGTYVVPDTGTPQRLSPGLLFATGRRHVIVRECDATLQCEFVLIDLASGERRTTPLDVDDRFAFYSQGSVAPDGGTLLYADWTGSEPANFLVDLGTGAAVDVELLRSAAIDVGPLDYWATDSSGVFLRTGSSIAFLPRDGTAGAELDGLGTIVSLAVQR